MSASGDGGFEDRSPNSNKIINCPVMNTVSQHLTQCLNLEDQGHALKCHGAIITISTHCMNASSNCEEHTACYDTSFERCIDDVWNCWTGNMDNILK